MARIKTKLSAATAIVAAFSMVATPAAALDLPRAGPVSTGAYDADAGNTERSRRHRHRHDRIDAGDVIAGVLILGGIAAIASAASKPRQPEVRYPERYPESRPRYAEPARAGSATGQGMERAVDMCVDAVEYEQGRVASVDGANRTGEGWQVTGELARGVGYSCWIGNDGRVREVEAYDRAHGAAGYEPVEDSQWDDDAYARARAVLGEPPAYQVATATGY